MGGHENYAPCAIEDLTNKGYDYWALGHVHQASVLHEKPHVVFPGNLQGRHARETGTKFERRRGPETLGTGQRATPGGRRRQ